LKDGHFEDQNGDGRVTLIWICGKWVVQMGGG